MQAFLLALMVKAVENEKIRAFLMEIVDRLGEKLLPKLASLIPLAVAAGLEQFGGLLGKAGNIDLPGLPPLGDLTHQIHDVVNGQIPAVDIPYFSDAIKQVTGFDLTDFLKGR